MDTIGPDDPRLHSCAEEPIQIPGAIQPHGFLVACPMDGETPFLFSENTPRWLGHEALRQTAEAWLPAEMLKVWRTARRDIDAGEHYKLGECRVAAQGEDPQRFEVIAHRSAQDHQLIEFIGLDAAHPAGDRLWYFDITKSILNALQRLERLEDYCDQFVQRFKVATSYDRVMIYRFDDRWNGQVIAEACNEGMEAYLGFHYPASDIPPQARALYEKTLLRVIPDVHYRAIPLVSSSGAVNPNELDLSHARLRAVSPVHVQYLKNMGVDATLTVSLMIQGRLWGMIACHHHAPRRASHDFIAACEFLAQIVAQQLDRLLQHQTLEDSKTLQAIHPRLIQQMTDSDEFMDGLIKGSPNVADLVNADGAAIVFSSELFTVGRTPSLEQVHSIHQWLQHHLDDSRMMFHTDHLCALMDGAETFKDTASGLLAVALSEAPHDMVLWFRGELRRSVVWAGDPTKAVLTRDDGSMAELQPRSSFAAWREEIVGYSRPWRPAELSEARHLRNPIVEMSLKQGRLLIRLNHELATAKADAERSNTNKTDALSNLSHEIRTPLNAIVGYSEMLKYAKAGPLSDQQQRYVDYVVDSARHLLSLINDLLDASRLEAGSLRLHPEMVDMAHLFTDTLAMMEPLAERAGVTLNASHDTELPRAKVDPKRVRQVFVNLLSNAVKYNRPGGKVTATLSYDAPENLLVMRVEDTGYGISAANRRHLFERFYRVEGNRQEQREGSGLGLTISKELVEMHGGRIEVESTLGAGSVFTVRLPTVAPAQ